MRLRVLALTAVIVVACGGEAPSSGCTLPALSAADHLARGLDDVPRFTLPDSGGVLSNGVAFPLPQLPTRVQEILAPRPSPTKVIFVEPVPPSRCGDLRVLIEAVEAVGGSAYDAAASDRLLPPPTRVKEP